MKKTDYLIKNYSRILEQDMMCDRANSFYFQRSLHEECGVFAICNIEEAAVFCALGLHALQHRGQESAGIACYDGKNMNLEKNAGLVGNHYNKREVIERLPGKNAIGHVRYSTQGGPDIRNAQPISANLTFGKTALCHNGNIVNAKLLIKSLSEKGAVWQTEADTELILHLMAQNQKQGFLQSFIEAHKSVIGGYAAIALCGDTLIGARDPLAIRPLVLGKIDDSYILASESCALDIIGAKFIREINGGEVVIINKKDIKSIYPFIRQSPRPCLFEYIYFARPDSIFAGRSIYEIRKSLGRQLALEYPIKNADVIVPVPDSGLPAAIGYAAETNVPFELGIVRNHYVGRTFIEPSQQIRELGVKLKHSANSRQLSNKNVVLIDDSVVRGTTSKKIVNMVYAAGAKSVSMLISAPPIKYPDYYGIDIPSNKQLISSNHSVAELKKTFKVEHLYFLSIDGLYMAISGKKRDNKKPTFSDHCFTGDYPTQIIKEDEADKSLQLRLIS